MKLQEGKELKADLRDIVILKRHTIFPIYVSLKIINLTLHRLSQKLLHLLSQIIFVAVIQQTT